MLFGRCVRDYLMYADAEGLIRIRWSGRILREMSRNQVAQVASFTIEQAERLCELMNAAAPDALVEPTNQDFASFEHIDLPDEGDRHVIAAAITADADVLCTSNIQDFPDEAMEFAGIMRLTPDLLLSALVKVHPDEMLQVHRTAVRKLPGATDQSTLNALRRSQCSETATVIQVLLDGQ